MMHNHDSSIQVIAPFSLLELEKLGYDLSWRFGYQAATLRVWDPVWVEVRKACKYKNSVGHRDTLSNCEASVIVHATSLERTWMYDHLSGLSPS